ncbi:MAG: RIO1 family regulatory kinase/ATPase domain-containing protein, partial [Candidatus Thorarchaeota archaeon]|jgi:RIO kinase 1
MEFIGDVESNLPAPLIKNVEIPSPVKVFNEIIDMIETGYTEAGLVHADLSEFNILWLGKPIIIDVSQAVLIGHDYAKKYLLRDIQNVCNYFKKLGVNTEEPEIIAKHIVSVGEK